MCWKVVPLVTLVAVFGTFAPVQGADALYIAETRNRPLTSDVSPKLSQALLATKDAGGELKGADSTGMPVIAVPADNVDKLKKSLAVVAAQIAPKSWIPVKRLKLSYKPGEALTKDQLQKLGLNPDMASDYKPGSFMIVEPTDGRIDAKLAHALEGSDKVLYVTPSFRVKAIPQPPKVAVRKKTTVEKPPTNDQLWEDLWGMRNIQAPVAWKKVQRSTAVVAVIDTGVDYTHEDLMDNIWADANGKHGYNFVNNNDDPMDKNGHGTHCSGTVGAVGNNMKGVVGVNWDIKIMGVRWLDANGSGEVANAIKAIDWAVEHGAQVLSNSWFWYEDDPDLEAAIKRAYAKNVLFIAAASNFALRPNNNYGDNDKPSTYGRYPSSYKLDNIISVAAINEANEKADFSNWGKKTVHLSAPGVLIMSTVPGDKYNGTYSGTSMATPHVAGTAALLLGHPKYAGSNPAKVRQLLIDNARAIAAMKDKCVSEGTLDISFLGK